MLPDVFAVAVARESASARRLEQLPGARPLCRAGHLIENGKWQEEDELAETYSRRKCFAYGRDGNPVKQAELLGSILKNVDAAYQNLESVELGVTSVDHYFDTLGGIARAVKRARGGQDTPVYIGDEVSLHAEIVRVGRSSMTIEVEAWRRSRDGEEQVKVTDASFVFVALDQGGRPRVINPVCAPKTEH